MQVLQDPALMSRQELQAALRALKLRSGGTNEQLRERLLSVQQQGTTEAATAQQGSTEPAPAVTNAANKEKRQ